MDTTIDEIADGIYRLSTLVEDAAPGGFSFNQFLLMADEPLLFHTGPRAMFPLVSEAMARVTPVSSLRWISFGHVESDECGAVNLWLDAAPDSQVVFNPLGCDVSVNDLCDRPPRALADGEVLDIGGKRIRLLATPHVPHGWEAQVLFEETTQTLCCGDLLSHTGGGPAITEDDVVGPAVVTDTMFGASSLAPQSGATIRSLAELRPRTLAIMHGSSYRGDGHDALLRLADAYDEMAAHASAR
jgi:flavorubredoxin